MIRSSIYGPNVNLMFNAIPNGIYDISIYVWEDNNAENYNVSAEGQIVVGNYNSGVGGTWTKLGPYRKIINDGTINISNAGGVANISGVEIKTVTTSTIAVTGLSISPSPFNVLIGKSAQLSRTISPANASNKSVSWVSSNPAVALVNNDG
ncbi:MAG: Ig-like domain-containing protein [Chryseolinea sp.]